MLIVFLNDRQVAFLVAKLFIIRHKMKRIIEYLCIDALSTQIIIQTFTILNLNDIQMVSMIDITCFKRSFNTINTLKCLIILFHQLTATLYVLTSHFQLTNAKSGLYVRQTIIET